MAHLHLVDTLLAGEALTDSAATEYMGLLLNPETPEALKGALLGLLRQKGTTGAELASFARFLEAHALRPIEPDPEVTGAGLVDTCGTGGGSPSFNLSTAAALVAAGAGARVAKHGNRAVTSLCGSADVLESLGVPIQSEMACLQAQLENVGITFLFAPNHHPTMKNVAPVRKALGFRTVFNQLGPLVNPFGARRRLLGVYARDLLLPMAEALVELGTQRALVVHAADGLDEISPCSATFAAEVLDGRITERMLTPEAFGLNTLPISAIAPGASVAEAAAILLEAVSDLASLRAQAALPNAAAALWLAGLADSLPHGVELASKSIASGRAADKLDALRTVPHAGGRADA